MIMAAKGGTGPRYHRRRLPGAAAVSAIECEPARSDGQRPYFYQLLHAIGVFPPGAPPPCGCSARCITGSSPPSELIDRYDLACRPVRDLLVDYLRERQPGLDYTTPARRWPAISGRLFWKDLEPTTPASAPSTLPRT